MVHKRQTFHAGWTGEIYIGKSIWTNLFLIHVTLQYSLLQSPQSHYQYSNLMTVVLVFANEWQTTCSKSTHNWQDNPVRYFICEFGTWLKLFSYNGMIDRKLKQHKIDYVIMDSIMHNKNIINILNKLKIFWPFCLPVCISSL